MYFNYPKRAKVSDHEILTLIRLISYGVDEFYESEKKLTLHFVKSIQKVPKQTLSASEH